MAGVRAVRLSLLKNRTDKPIIAFGGDRFHFKQNKQSIQKYGCICQSNVVYLNGGTSSWRRDGIIGGIRWYYIN